MIKFKNIFPLFFVGTIISTLLGIFYPYIIVWFFSILVFKRLKNEKIFNFGLNNNAFMFLIYFFTVSFIAFLFDIINIKYFIEFVIKFLIMPFVVINLIPNDSKKIEESLIKFRNLIVFFAIYGMIESILGYNPLENFIMIDNKVWLTQMNDSLLYQPSSFFLHYSYYCLVLVVGWILNETFKPEKKLNLYIIRLLLLSQIIISQSRIGWIAFIVVCLITSNAKKLFKKKKTLGMLLLLFTIIFVVGVLNFNVILGIFDFISRKFDRIFLYGFEYGSFGQRIGTFLNFGKYFVEYPIRAFFGTGYSSINGHFMQNYSYFRGYTTADSQWTIFLVESGIIGIILFIRFLYSYFKNNKNSLLKNLLLVVILIESVTLDLVNNNIMLIIIYFAFNIKYISKAAKVSDSSE